ncbi:fungal-specific transcription factor domain-containing protein [Poronia punctata]|nr:fungal-specific transcription factor domain-containing protein [Poronia punctata]
MSERKACHNCRRRRLRCDRSVPTCYKCAKTGQECLGYGQLYRWVDSEKTVGSQVGHGRSITPAVSATSYSSSAGAICDVDRRTRSYHEESDALGLLGDDQLIKPFVVSIADPLLQDLDASSRRYMSYFSFRFCQDLVIHDSAELGTNPFRELIPMSQTYPYLQQIIIAVSAVHYYNTLSNNTTSLKTTVYSPLARAALIDALNARQKAIRGLITIIQQKQTGKEESRGRQQQKQQQADQDALLATVLFFVNFTLIDSGREDWKGHLTAAGRLLSYHGLSTLSFAHVADKNYMYSGPFSTFTHGTTTVRPPITTSEEEAATYEYQQQGMIDQQPLTACDYVASDTIAYLIWNCAIGTLVSSSSSSSHQHRQPSPSSSPDKNQTPDFDFSTQILTWDVTKVLKILSRTEANSYHSCPTLLMGIVLRASRITQYLKLKLNHHSHHYSSSPQTMTKEYLTLLHEASTFNIDTWASGVSTHVIGILRITAESDQDELLKVRRHIAATYRAAVCLYILLVAPHLSSLLPTTSPTITIPIPSSEELVSSILHHLSFIPKTSAIFKFTVWPLFLTGVDAVSDIHRSRVSERLRAMRDICPWNLLTSAIETLREIWKLRDEMLEAEQDWLSRLRGLKIDCLIV